MHCARCTGKKANKAYLNNLDEGNANILLLAKNWGQKCTGEEVLI